MRQLPSLLFILRAAQGGEGKLGSVRLSDLPTVPPPRTGARLGLTPELCTWMLRCLMYSWKILCPGLSFLDNEERRSAGRKLTFVCVPMASCSALGILPNPVLSVFPFCKDLDIGRKGTCLSYEGKVVMIGASPAGLVEAIAGPTSRIPESVGLGGAGDWHFYHVPDHSWAWL